MVRQKRTTSDSLVKKNSYFVFYSVSPITFYNEEMYISVTGAGTILEKEINGIKYMRTSVGDHYDYRLKYNIFKRRFRLKKAIPHFRGLNLFY
jgi:hypothetical protein